ncbi:MAG: hypothetical protein ACPGVU_05510 [Limisphaerales bacterium]
MLQFPELNTRDRLIVTACSVFLFVWGAGFEVLELRVGFRLFLTFIVGVLIAVWAGHESIGSFPPVSIRPAYILLGCLMMFFSFVVVIIVRLGIR